MIRGKRSSQLEVVADPEIQFSNILTPVISPNRKLPAEKTAKINFISNHHHHHCDWTEYICTGDGRERGDLRSMMVEEEGHQSQLRSGLSCPYKYIYRGQVRSGNLTQQLEEHPASERVESLAFVFPPEVVLDGPEDGVERDCEGVEQQQQQPGQGISHVFLVLDDPDCLQDHRQEMRHQDESCRTIILLFL